MNILYLSNSSEIGGGEKCLESLFQGLRGTGVKPIVICPGPGPFVDMLHRMGVLTLERKLVSPSLGNPVSSLADLLWLLGTIRRHRVDLVHANSSLGGRKAALAARLGRVPLICHIHYPLSAEHYRWVYRRMPLPRRFIYVCHALQRDIGNLHSQLYPELGQSVIYNGIDTAIYAPRDVENEVPRIGIIANLQKVKGHEDFLAMASLLKREGVEARFEIIGGDVQKQGRKEELEALARNLSVDDRVRFHGFVDDVVGLLQGLDILVCSSHEEASPRCIIEAMSCRKPIVATRVNGIPDVLRHEENGLLVADRAPAELAAAVKRLLGDPALRRRLAYQGWKDVNENYSLEVYTRSIIDIYHAELGEAAPAGKGLALAEGAAQGGRA